LLFIKHALGLTKRVLLAGRNARIAQMNTPKIYLGKKTIGKSFRRIVLYAAPDHSRLAG